MLLPQSSAFATLKNRLNAVSAIGYLSVPRPLPPGASGGYAASSNSFSSNPNESGGRPNRLKSRDDGIRWADLFEKFRATQERQRRRGVGYIAVTEQPPSVPEKEGRLAALQPSSRPGSGMAGLVGRGQMVVKEAPKEKERKGGPLGLGRFGGGSRKKK